MGSATSGSASVSMNWAIVGGVALAAVAAMAAVTNIGKQRKRA